MKSITNVQDVERDLADRKVYAIILKLMMQLGALTVLNVTEVLLTWENSNSTTWESTLIQASDGFNAFFVQRRLQPEQRLRAIWEVTLRKIHSFVIRVTTRIPKALTWKFIWNVFTVLKYGTHINFYYVNIISCFNNNGILLLFKFSFFKTFIVSYKL